MAIVDRDLAHIEVGLIRPGDAEVGGIDVDTVGAEVGRKKACCNDLVEELSWAVGSDRVQSSAEHIVVEVVPRDALPEETFDGDVVKEVGKQVETALDEPETVEDHGFEHLGVAEMVGTGFRRAASIISDLEVVAPATMPRWSMERIGVSSKPSTEAY